MAKTIKPPKVSKTDKHTNDKKTTPPTVIPASQNMKNSKKTEMKPELQKVSSVTSNTDTKEIAPNRTISKVVGLILILLGSILLVFSIYKYIFPLLPPIPTNKEAPVWSMESPFYTKDKIVTVKGKVEDNHNIEWVAIAINDKYEFKTDTTQNGEFSQQLALKEVNKEYHIKSYAVYSKFNLKFKTKESADLPIIYDNTAPNIEIPNIPQRVTDKILNIHVKIDEPSKITIKINENEITTETDGNFDQQLELKSGKNSLYFIVEDKAGNTVEKGPFYIYYVQTNSKTSNSVHNKDQLPKSAGIFDNISNILFKRLALKLIAVILTLLYLTYTSVTWLKRTYKK